MREESALAALATLSGLGTDSAQREEAALVGIAALSGLGRDSAQREEAALAGIAALHAASSDSAQREQETLIKLRTVEALDRDSAIREEATLAGLDGLHVFAANLENNLNNVSERLLRLNARMQLRHQYAQERLSQMSEQLARMEQAARAGWESSKGVASAVDRVEAAVREAVQHAATSLAVAGRVEAASAHILDRADTIAAAVRQAPDVASEALARIEATAAQSVEHAGATLGIVARLEAASAHILDRADTIAAAVRQAPDAASEALARIEATAAQGVEHAGATLGIVARLEAVSTHILDRADAIAESLRHAPGSVYESLARVERASADAAEHARVLSERLSRVESAIAHHSKNALQLGENVLLVGLDGIMLMPAEDITLVGFMMASSGVMEPGTRRVVLALLPPGGTFLDLGAHIGTMTIPAARQVGSAGKVIAVEPTPRTAALLRRNVQINGFDGGVTVLECAVGARRGSALLNVSQIYGHNSLLALDEATTAVEVPVTPVDELVQPGTRVDLVKIDVEGFELEVWRGMKRVIADNPRLAVIMEFGPSHLARAGLSILEWVKEVRRPGFKLFEIDELSGECRPLRPVKRLHEVISVNVLLLPGDPSSYIGLDFAGRSGESA